MGLPPWVSPDGWPVSSINPGSVSEKLRVLKPREIRCLESPKENPAPVLPWGAVDNQLISEQVRDLGLLKLEQGGPKISLNSIPNPVRR